MTITANTDSPRTPRVRLRPPADGDAVLVAPWLAEAVAAVNGRGAAVDTGLTLDALAWRWDAVYPPGETLLGELRDGTPVGLLRVRDTVRGRLVMDALTVRAEARNLGYGQEMVFALEEAWGVPGGTAAAGVPRANGLAVYFWLRTGYRPLYPLPAGAPPDLDRALLWMVRELT